MWKKLATFNIIAMFAPLCLSTSQTPPLWKQHWLASKVRSDDIRGLYIVFCIPKNLLPGKTAHINQLQAGKCWRFLFCKKKIEWNRKWHHFGFHLCNWDLKKPFSAKFDCFTVWWLCAPPYCFHAHMQSKDPPLSLHNEWPILSGRGIGCCLTEFYGLYSGKNNSLRIEVTDRDAKYTQTVWRS